MNKGSYTGAIKPQIAAIGVLPGSVIFRNKKEFKQTANRMRHLLWMPNKNVAFANRLRKEPKRITFNYGNIIIAN